MRGFLTGLMAMTEEPLLWLKGAIVFLIGPIDFHLAYLMLAMSVDLAFGVQLAVRERAFSWKKMYQKFGSKAKVYLLWIIMFHAFDMIAGLPDSARWSLILILVGMEIVSAIKNTSRLGHSDLAEALSNLYLTLIRPRHHHKGGTHDERIIEEAEELVERLEKITHEHTAEHSQDSDRTNI